MEKIPLFLRCPVCVQLFIQPVQLPCCGTPVCWGCASTKLNQKTACWLETCYTFSKNHQYILTIEKVIDYPALADEVKMWRNRNVKEHDKMEDDIAAIDYQIEDNKNAVNNKREVDVATKSDQMENKSRATDDLIEDNTATISDQREDNIIPRDDYKEDESAAIEDQKEYDIADNTETVKIKTEDDITPTADMPKEYVEEANNWPEDSIEPKVQKELPVDETCKRLQVESYCFICQEYGHATSDDCLILDQKEYHPNSLSKETEVKQVKKNDDKKYIESHRRVPTQRMLKKRRKQRIKKIKRFQTQPGHPDQQYGVVDQQSRQYPVLPDQQYPSWAPRSASQQLCELSTVSQQIAGLPKKKKYGCEWMIEELMGDLATTGMILYVNINLQNLRTEIPISYDRKKNIVKIWKKLPSEERALYVKKAKENQTKKTLRRLRKIENNINTDSRSGQRWYHRKKKVVKI